jgi:pimeloyl-ACP methyl ester carboxylesterase
MMTTSDTGGDLEQPAAPLFAGLAGRLEGDPDHRAPLILLHGLTFDRTMWQPALAELRQIDPGRRVLAVDLPGHGRSPAWPRYDVEGIAEGVHRAAEDANLRSPVVVGHSFAAVIATVYAARYPARGVVNVDQWLQIEPVATLAQSLAGQIRGPGFPAAWQVFEASMHIELLPRAAQELLQSSRNLRHDLVAGYWRELLDRPVAELAGNASAWLAALRASQVPYLFVAGHQVEPEYQNWLNHMLPQASVTVWPGSGHFPHLADPGRFAACLAATARWGDPAARAAGTSATYESFAADSRLPR